jgi:hypothetical protein
MALAERGDCRHMVTTVNSKAPTLNTGHVTKMTATGLDKPLKDTRALACPDHFQAESGSSGG